MIIFKTIWKVTKQHRWEALIPLIIFISFAGLSSMSASKSYDNFTRTKPVVAIINHDLEVGQGLVEYLNDKVEWVNIAATEFEAAVFYQQVHLALEIPEGYTEDFLENDAVLDAELLMDSSSGYIAQEYINNYLRNYKALSIIGLSDAEIKTEMMQLSETNPRITLIETESTEGMTVFENFSNLSIYPLMICIIGILVTVLVVFDEKEVFQRMVVSSKSSSRRNAELFLGAMALGHALFMVLWGIQIIVMFNHIQWETYLWSILNFYMMFLVSMSAAFAISKVVKSKSMQSAITNSVSLGLSFVSGVFVPLYMLDSSIVNIAKLFPLYWNVEVNTMIARNTISLDTIGFPILIQLLYCVVMIVAALIVSRRKMEING